MRMNDRKPHANINSNINNGTTVGETTLVVSNNNGGCGLWTAMWGRGFGRIPLDAHTPSYQARQQAQRTQYKYIVSVGALGHVVDGDDVERRLSHGVGADVTCDRVGSGVVGSGVVGSGVVGSGEMAWVRPLSARAWAQEPVQEWQAWAFFQFQSSLAITSFVSMH